LSYSFRPTINQMKCLRNIWLNIRNLNYIRFAPWNNCVIIAHCNYKTNIAEFNVNADSKRINCCNIFAFPFNVIWVVQVVKPDISRVYNCNVWSRARFFFFVRPLKSLYYTILSLLHIYKYIHYIYRWNETKHTYVYLYIYSCWSSRLSTIDIYLFINHVPIRISLDNVHDLYYFNYTDYADRRLHVLIIYAQITPIRMLYYKYRFYR